MTPCQRLIYLNLQKIKPYSLLKYKIFLKIVEYYSRLKFFITKQTKKRKKKDALPMYFFFFFIKMYYSEHYFLCDEFLRFCFSSKIYVCIQILMREKLTINLSNVCYRWCFSENNVPLENISFNIIENKIVIKCIATRHWWVVLKNSSQHLAIGTNCNVNILFSSVIINQD